jgi:hypothetical protein
MSENIEKATKMINDFVLSKGIDLNQVYNAEKRSWSLKRGSANIQVILLEVPISTGTREFLQIACPLIKVSAGKELQLYKRLLELNDAKLGVKLSLQEKTDQVWALNERDLSGLDYSELTTMLEDLGYWADEFDDMLAKEFS